MFNYKLENGQPNIKKIVKHGVIVFVLFLALTLFRPFVVIGAGQRGVVLNWGAVSDSVMGEGLHFRIPLMQKIQRVDVKTVKHEVGSLAYSKDLQVVDASIALNYHVDAENPNKLLQEIGKDYESRIIDPSIQESVKSALAKFTAQELVDQRPKVKDEIRTELSNRLNGRHLIVDDFSIVNFDFSDAYEAAVEAKQVAQQNALKAENDLQRIKVEASQRVAQANAEAEAIRAQSDAANNQNYIQLKALEVQAKALEKWNGKLPDYMIPGAVLPFLGALNK